MNTQNSPYAKTIVRKRNSNKEVEPSKDLKHERLVQKVENKHLLHSRAEKLAGVRTCYMNWKWPEANMTYPSKPWMRHVRKYFPDAIGGPLLIDEPEIPGQVKACEEKREFLKALGYRYVILYPNKTEIDDLLELEKCGPLKAKL